MYGEREYRIVRADGGCEMFWTSSNNAGVFEKTTDMAGGCQGGVDKVRNV